MGGYDDTPAALYDYHHSMLVDRERTEAFLRALMAEVRPGDVVVDIGAGTGVLSMFAAMAGARHVYAIEEGPIGEVAIRAIEHNGFADRITVLRGRSTEIELPVRGTVLVTETIGNVGLEEGITAWVRDAQERLLTPDARFIPRSVAVVAAPVEVHEDHGELTRWKRPQYTLDFSALLELGVNNLLWAELAPRNLVAEPIPIIEVDLTARPDSDVAGSARFVSQRECALHGIGVWFRAELVPGRFLTNGPPLRTPSWNQGYLPLLEPIHVRKGDEIDITIEATSDAAIWAWTVAVDGSAVARHSSADGSLGT
ncbi:MAG: 50S ribosomal protein L11 methyltransferase [Actinobacteria bacterium]|nr:50S ribosomal protein L11 methyltransferase [Actinomycetota bacterium]